MKIQCLFLFVVSLLTITFLNACGVTSGALPQASVPIPENDPITISSPSASGLVTVTGNTDAVPGDVTLVASVSSASSSFNIDFLSRSLFAQAVAQSDVCPSGFPPCPTLSNGSCEAEASSDGSFQFTLPAADGDQITVNYLDPDNDCSETDGFTGTVADNIAAMDVSAVSLALDTGSSNVLVFGTSGGDPIIDVRSSQDGSAVTTLSPDVGATPIAIHFLKSSNEDKFLVMQSKDGTLLAPYSNPTIDTAGQRKFVSNTADTIIENLKFLAGDQFQTPLTSDNSCIGSDFVTGETFTRLFLTNGSKLYILDTLEDFNLDKLSVSGNLIPRVVELKLTDLVGISVVRIPFIAVLEKTFVIIAGFSDGSSDDVTYYALELSRDSGFCSANLEVGSDAARILLATTSSSVFAAAFKTQDSDGKSIVKIGLLNIETQTIKFIDGTNMENAETIGIEESVTSYDDLAISDVTKFLGITRSGSSVFELFLLGKSNGGGGFVASDGSDTQFGTGTLVNAINPVALRFDVILNNILVLDGGLSDTDLSNLIFIDVSQ